MRLAVVGGTGVVGKFVVEAATTAGHDVVSLSRRTGVDVRSGEGLAEALRGVEVIVDTTNAGTTNRDKATAFFTEVTRNLGVVGAGEGVSRLVILSIVGLERVPGYGYYQAKLAHEKAALSGPLPATIVRATQFHEFPAQVLSWTRHGPFAVVPRSRIQPVAARAVGGVLLDVAVAVAVAPASGAGIGSEAGSEAGSEHSARIEVAGPEEADLVSLARAVVRERGERLRVIPFRVPGPAGKAMRTGGQLPTSGVRIVGPTFSEWIEGSDLSSVG
jgi:uncharacterized protein YbjT (DUF2867 family)